jgi:hypothetical protein
MRDAIDLLLERYGMPAKAKRESITDVTDRLYMAVMGARAAVLTTIVAIDDHQLNTVMGAVTINLRRAAMNPLDEVLTELATAKSGECDQ